MEYQKVINLLDNTQNESLKFKIKNLVGTNDESRWAYDKDNQIKLEIQW